LRRRSIAASLNPRLTLAEKLAQPIEALTQLCLEAAVGRLVKVLAADRLGSQRLVGDRLGLVVRIAVALAPPELLGSGVVGVLEI
jgi:hypothetical protein